MKRMWSPEELQALAASVADAEILAKVNISYSVVSDVPTWTMGTLKIGDGVGSITVGSTKPIVITALTRFNNTVYDSDGNAGSVKKIYWHTIHFQRGGSASTSEYNRLFGHMIILNNSATPITQESFINLIRTEGFVGVIINGKYSATPASDLTGMTLQALKIVYSSSENRFVLIHLDSDNVETSITLSTDGWSAVEDLGVNAIN